MMHKPYHNFVIGFYFFLKGEICILVSCNRKTLDGETIDWQNR